MLEISKICQLESLDLDYPYSEEPCNNYRYKEILCPLCYIDPLPCVTEINMVKCAIQLTQSIKNLDTLSDLIQILKHIFFHHCLIGSDIVVNPHSPSGIKATR